MNSFLYTIIDDLIAKGWDNLRNYTLVFPMQRASLYAKQYLRDRMKAAKLDHPVVLPRMLTIDQLVDDLSDYRLVDEIHAVCLLYEVYKKNTNQAEALSLDAFYGWGRQLCNDFSNVDMSLNDVHDLMKDVADWNKYDDLMVDEEQRDELLELLHKDRTNAPISQFFHDLWNTLPAMYDSYKDELEKEKLGTKGACYRWVIEHFDEVLPRLENRTFVFAGFNYLLPAERRLMTLLKEHDQAIFYWDYDTSFELDTNVYKFIRENIETDKFRNELPAETETGNKKKITAISTSSANAQAQYVNQWLTENHKEGQRTAVVITDENMLEAVIQALPENCSKRVNITKGYPLANTATYSEVIKYLMDEKNNKCANEKDYIGVLTRLSKKLTLPVALENAETAGWFELVQQEAYCQTQLVINRFVNLIEDKVLNDVTELRTLRNLLRRCMDMVTLPFHGEPVEEIQIIGVLETRLLDFDNLLILNVEEGVVPGLSRDSSFIPFGLRKEHHMNTYEEDAIVYAYNFFRLLRRSENVTLLFSEAAGSTSKKTMSRFLMQMILSPAYDVTKLRLTESSKTSDVAALTPSKTWLDTAKERWYRPTPTAADNTKGMTLSLSPSALGSYIECPRQFYLSSILHVSEPDQQELILERNEHGSIFHSSAEVAYSKISGEKDYQQIKASDILDFIDDKNWEDNFKEVLDKAYQDFIENYDKRHLDDQCGKDLYVQNDHPAENEVVKGMLYNTLKSDAEQLGDFVLCSQEEELRRCIHIPGCDIPILLGGFIDRLDIIQEDGNTYLRVLDYKTGSHKPEKVSSKNLESLFTDHEKQYLLQTLIYSSVCYEYRQMLAKKGKDVKLPKVKNEEKLVDDERTIADLPIMPQLMYTQKLSADRHVTINEEPITDYANQGYHPESGSDGAASFASPVLIRERFEELLRAKISDILADTTFEKCDEQVCGKSFCAFHALCGRKKSKW